MKRILAVLLAGLMLLFLAACGEKKDESINAAMLEADGLSAAIRAHDAEKHPGMIRMTLGQMPAITVKKQKGMQVADFLSDLLTEYIQLTAENV